ncbi:hypothetical protein S245_008247 [Arachis hypogaea]
MYIHSQLLLEKQVTHSLFTSFSLNLVQKKFSIPVSATFPQKQTLWEKNVLSLQFPLPFVLFPLLHVHLFWRKSFLWELVNSGANPSYGNSSTQMQRLPRQFLRPRCSSPVII